MSKYFETIEKAKEHKGLFETFGYSDTNSEQLQKSHVDDIFEEDAPSRGFTIDKNGIDIKERLVKLLAETQENCSVLRTKWTAMLEKFDKKPSEPATKGLYYWIDGWEDKIGELPAIFNWEEICSRSLEESPSSDVSFSVEAEQPNPEKELAKQKGDYNDAVEKYIKCRKEIALLETMLANFDDEKVYKLTVKEASMLGW